MHDGPARAEKRIGQPEADKGDIDKREQKRIHSGSPCLRGAAPHEIIQLIAQTDFNVNKIKIIRSTF